MGILIFLLARNGANMEEISGFLADRFFTWSFLLFAHLFFVICYSLFLLVRYLYRTYKKRGLKGMLKRGFFRIVLPALLIFLSFRLLIFYNTAEDYNYIWDTSVENTSGVSRNFYATDGKHRGMSVFGWNKENSKAVDSLIKNNVEWVAVTPFLYQENEQSALMRVPKEIGTWSRRDSTFIIAIKELHAKGIHVQLKPHLWMGDGWRSNVNHPTPEAWSRWFASYQENMLHYASMAQHTGAELFCVGTELKSALRAQPEAWKTLVNKIKQRYTGKLTYASNWDGEFKEVPFWDQMDYIGIQAYFPLTKTKNPELAAIKEGWDRHIVLLEELYKEHQRPILFTEVGYKSEAAATIRPWEWDSALSALKQKKSDLTQQRAYEALYQTLWHKPWFAGAYIWQWDTRTTEDSLWLQMDFSPRYKPAQNTIAKWYGPLGKLL